VKKPVKPQKPFPPYPPYLGGQVRLKVGPLKNEDKCYDDPVYPTINIEYIEKWAKANNIDDPQTVTVDMHLSAMELEMVLEGYETITDEMRAQAEADHQEALNTYETVTLLEYEVAFIKYNEDLRTYYK